MQKIEYIAIEKLKPHPNNPRLIKDAQFKVLCESVKNNPDYFETRPILCNKDMIIFAGNQRFSAAKESGFKKVPVCVMDISPERQKELMLRDNKQNGEWIIEELVKFDQDMLMNVGFGEELDEYWDSMLEIESDGFNLEKSLKEITEPITKYGDLWKLGDCRLLVGDSTKEADVLKLLGEEKASMVYCDPPYNIGLNYSKGIGTSTKYRKDFPDLKYKGVEIKDNKKVEEYKKFLDDTIKNALKIALPDCHFFYWCDQKYIWLLQQLYMENGIHNERVCLWIKQNFNVTPQKAFNKVFEPCVYGTTGSPFLNSNLKNLNEIMNKEVGSGNQALDDILDIINVWLVKRDPTQEYLHPTQKPITLNERPIKRCTKAGDLIVDLFGGSGSSLLSAFVLKRRAYLIERDEIFATVILNRFEKYAGIKPVRINN